MRSPELLEIREKVLKILKDLARRLDATIYLFGSYARGDHLLDSDVDIVVVSSRFKGMNYADRVAMIRLMLPQDMSFDIIALTPKEFEERKRRSFFEEISRYWIEIKSG